jgi:LysM repeat protein
MASSKLWGDDLEKSTIPIKQQTSGNKTSKKSNYGSLRKEIQQTTSAFIVNYKHKLQAGETLQGISLKYGVPVRT